MNEFSLNGRFILEPYQSEHQIKAAQGTGFAMIQQKTNLVGLKLLVDVRTGRTSGITMDGFSSSWTEQIKKGSVAWVREELLYTQPWAKSLYSCKGLEGKFIIVDPQYIEFVTPAVDENT